MLIKSLELENFKSFKTKQKIFFKKHNLIVGKNGSGKSNLLKALQSVFEEVESPVSFHNNEEPVSISIEINNEDQRFYLERSFVISVRVTNKVEYFINTTHITRDEVRNLFINAGLTSMSFVRQGHINDYANMDGKGRYKLICSVAGIEKYEESKKAALRLMESEAENEITEMASKIEDKVRNTEKNKDKKEEYDRNARRKKELEFDLLRSELAGINKQIGSIMEEAPQKEEIDEMEVEEAKERIKVVKEQIRHDELLLSTASATIGLKITELTDSNTELALLRKEEVALNNKEEEVQINYKASKYFEALGDKKEDPEKLKRELEEVKGRLQSDQRVQERPSYEALVKQRKELWTQERSIKEQMEKEEKESKTLRNKLIYMGKESVTVYEKLREKKGVHGLVWELFDVPKEISRAFEAVLKGSLFHIVVDDATVATECIKETETAVTFINLRGVTVGDGAPAASCTVTASGTPLSSFVKCDPLYRPVLLMLCKGFLLCPDLSVGNPNANIVNLDGDLVSNTGVITGGYDKTFILGDLMANKEASISLGQMLDSLRGQLLSLNKQIELSSFNGDSNSNLESKVNLRAYQLYLENKIKYMKSRKISIMDSLSLKRELLNIREKLPKLRLRIKSMESRINLEKEKRSKMEAVEEATARLGRSKMELDALFDKISQVTEVDQGLSLRLMEKYSLISRRTELLRKIGLNDFHDGGSIPDRAAVLEELRVVNKNLKSLFIYSFLDQDSGDFNMEIRNKLNELRGHKDRILDFIDILDRRKAQTLNLTFSMISDNFSYFYNYFTGDTAGLVLAGDTVEIKTNNTNVIEKSGGQKSIISLCLIFAIQKNDPSPFYCFDEIDANLDVGYVTKLYNLIKESEAQYFITSFKADSLSTGERIFGVATKDKESYVDEISHEVASNLIST